MQQNAAALHTQAVKVADKAARALTGVTFRATLAGAIHTTEITGTVSV